MKILELLSWAEQELSSHDNAKLEAQILLAVVLNCERAYLYAWPEKEIPEDHQKIFENLVARRSRNEPIAYLVGQREFWSLPLIVTKDTLVPRFETELLVQTVLTLLPKSPCLIADLGTGCGTIACALAHERSQWLIIAGDVSFEALKIAKQNAHALKLHNIFFIQSNWLQGWGEGLFDAIVSNPPYIRESDLHLISGDLPFEPRIALTPGPLGLEAFKIIIAQSKRCLKPEGLLAFEHGFDQAQALAQLLEKNGFKQIKTFTDHSGNARVTVGYLI